MTHHDDLTPPGDLVTGDGVETMSRRFSINELTYFIPDPNDDDNYARYCEWIASTEPFDWDQYAATGEPHTMTATEYLGYGPDAEEREIEVEVRPNYPTKEQVFG